MGKRLWCFPTAFLLVVGVAVVGNSGWADEQASAQTLFKRLDSNEDGWLSGTELQKGLWLKYDANADKEVTRREFLSGYSREHHAVATKGARPTKTVSKVRAGKSAARPVKPTANKTLFGASGLPLQFYSTWTYRSYLIFDKRFDNGAPTVTRGVGGTITLGPNGTYEKELTFPGPYGINRFAQRGHYQLTDIKSQGRLKVGKITFNYLDSGGKGQSYGGDFNFDLQGLSLVMTLNQDVNGKEIYGLVVKGTENVARKYDDNGQVILGS